MVSLKDFLKIMEGSEVTLCTSCWDETLEIETSNLVIHIDGKTYSSVDEVYNHYKRPKVKNWRFEQPYSDKNFLEIWCEA